MKKLLEEILPAREGELKWNTEDTPHSISISPGELHEFMKKLYETEGLYFDMLSCISGIDNGPEAGTMEVIYNLTSIPYEHHLMVKVEVSRESPSVPTVCDIWRTAEWLERETFDLLGIRFEGHPDLRRILLPADWKGYPLRKDYTHEEYYHGIRIAY
ncbi:MAG: NADH-quinone oxidoreductase subunit C [Cyclobacteriaceae bacterium]